MNVSPTVMGHRVHHQHPRKRQRTSNGVNDSLILTTTTTTTPQEWREAREFADEVQSDVKAILQQSRLQRQRHVLLVQRHEVCVERLLGTGAFSEVHQVRLDDPNRDDRDNSTSNNDNNNRKRYAMKHLKAPRDGTNRLSMDYTTAAAELAIEAHLLASLYHPNIIAIRGWAANGVASFANGARHDDFFLLLDCLDETLDQCLGRWQQEQHQAKAAGTNTPQIDHTAEQWQICHEMASALAYLHQQGIVFRDLKPQNIGFRTSSDQGRRVLQLFDFGLSREVPSLDCSQTFEMSGKVGTLRYMAVEVARKEPYNCKADVYSWAMVCHQVWTGVKPFSNWTRSMHQQWVCGPTGLRPDLDHDRIPISSLLAQAWHAEAAQRPSMSAVESQLQVLIQQQQQQQQQVTGDKDDIIQLDLRPIEQHLDRLQEQEQLLLHRQLLLQREQERLLQEQLGIFQKQQQAAPVAVPHDFFKLPLQRTTSNETMATMLSHESWDQQFGFGCS